MKSKPDIVEVSCCGMVNEEKHFSHWACYYDEETQEYSSEVFNKLEGFIPDGLVIDLDALSFE